MQDKWGGWKWGVEGAQGAPWGPQGPLGGPRGPLGPLGPLGGPSRAPLGPLGPLGGLGRAPRGPLGPKSIAMGADNFKTLPKHRLWSILGSKIGEQKIGIQAPGPPRRDPGRNSVQDPGFKVPSGGMATHLVAKRCDLGSLGVPGPASTPWAPRGPWGPLGRYDLVRSFFRRLWQPWGNGPPMGSLGSP